MTDITYSIVNGTAKNLSDVTICIGEHYQAKHGILVPDAPSGAMEQVRIKSENQIEITWTNQEGSQSTATTKVSSAELLHDRGVSFTIQSDGTLTSGFHYPEGF